MYAPTNLGQLGYTAEDAAWLRNEYVSILGYPADEAGFNYWAKRIDEVGREPVHQSFLDVGGESKVVKNGSGDVVAVKPASTSLIPDVPDAYLYAGLAVFGLLLYKAKR